MAIAETAARKLLHGGGGAAIARGVADAAGTFSFGLDCLWQLISGFFADIFAHLFAAVAGVAHLLVLPLEMLWRWILAAVAGAAGAISSGLNGLWHSVAGFFPHLYAAVAGALDGLWQLVAGFIPHVYAAVAGAAHELVLQLEAFWRWLQAAIADGAGTISLDVDGLWQLVTGFFAGIFVHLSDALAVASHKLPLQLEALWRWLQAAAAVAIPYVLGVAAVLLLVALVWFCWPALCAVAVGACKVLVVAVCYLGFGLLFVGVALARAFAFLLQPCVQCCAVVTMKAPDAAGSLISRAAFVAHPQLYFQILRTAGPVVATVIFCTHPGALIFAVPIAALFRAATPS